MNSSSTVDSELLRGTVEERTLKKHLPLRQKTDKPTIRYDTAVTKPLQMLNQNCVVTRRDSRGQPVSAPGTPATALPSGSKTQESSGSSPNAKKNRNSNSSPSASAKGVSNPYSRPLSAKEIIRDVQQSHRNRRLQLHSSITPPASSIPPPVGTSAFHGYDFEIAKESTLQFNSFLRPQGGSGYDPGAQRNPLQRRRTQSPCIGREGLGADGGGDIPFRASLGAAFHSDRPVGPKLARAVAEQSAKAVLQQAFALVSTTAAGNPPAPPTGLPPRPRNLSMKDGALEQSAQRKSELTVRNPNYSPNKPYQDVNTSDINFKAKDVAEQQSASSKRPFVSMPPATGSTAKPYLVSTFQASSVETLAVSDTTIPSKVPLNKLVPNGANGLNKDLFGRAIPGKLISTSPSDYSSSLLNGKANSLRKLPITTAMPGTLYYKKSFRDGLSKRADQANSFQSVVEQRPRADGAPTELGAVLSEAARDLKLREKVIKSISATCFDNLDEEFDDSIDEEDDSSTPCGERLPGDGEASIEELDDEDDGIEDLYEDCVEDDGESDGYTVSSSLSHASTSTIQLQSASSRPSTTPSAYSHEVTSGDKHTHSHAQPLTSVETATRPALRLSLFPSIPPSINFVVEGEKVELLPWAIRKFLKWRLSPITPNIVKSALSRSNFRITKRNHDWIGCFGKHMKANAFKTLREYQKLNHFPGSFQLGRKDRLWRNLSRMQVSFGKKDFGFFPHTYVLPQDFKLLKRSWEDSTVKQKWIIKPPASARGIGIKVIHKWNQIPRRRPVIVQKYLSHPLLINDSKFDMRIYVYVSSYDPLRAYVYEDGLARFASCKYSSSAKSLNNKFMHLTNYSVNKRNTDYQSNTDEMVCQGHKWSLKALWNYLSKQGVNTHAVWDNIKDIVVKTLISAEAPINSMTKASVRSRYVAHELFGFDILLDDQYKPWILEVNISPSLHSNSQLDINVKGQMICDMLNLAGYRVPDKSDIVHGSQSSASLPDMSSHFPTSDYCMDRRLFTSVLAPDERAKHAYFCHRYQDEQVLQGILDILTPDDVRILTESIDEDSRKGGFIRVFPTPATKKYLRYFEQPRYYNLLLDQWVIRYNKTETRGITLLQGLCEEEVHLESPTEGHKCSWYPPNCTAMMTVRDKPSGSPQRKEAAGQGKASSSSMARLPKMKNGAKAATAAPTSLSPFPSHATSASSSCTSQGSWAPAQSTVRSLDPAR